MTNGKLLHNNYMPLQDLIAGTYHSKIYLLRLLSGGLHCNSLSTCALPLKPAMWWTSLALVHRLSLKDLKAPAEEKHDTSKLAVNRMQTRPQLRFQKSTSIPSLSSLTLKWYFCLSLLSQVCSSGQRNVFSTPFLVPSTMVPWTQSWL